MQISFKGGDNNPTLNSTVRQTSCKKSNDSFLENTDTGRDAFLLTSPSSRDSIYKPNNKS